MQLFPSSRRSSSTPPKKPSCECQTLGPDYCRVHAT
jgi:hypothetical protein